MLIFKKKIQVLILSAIFSLLAVSMAPANTFTENFTTNTYENTGATTAKWDYTVNHQLVLSNANQFAETTGVIDWGGGVISIDYDKTKSIWLIG